MLPVSLLLLTMLLLINHTCYGFVFKPLHIVRHKLTRHMASTFSPPKTSIPNNNGFQVQPPYDTNQLINLNDDNFDEAMSSDGLSVVLFGATWCGPCANMARTLSMCAQSNSMAKFYAIDTDINPESASIYGVRSIPCVLLFKDGRVVSEVVGSVPASVIEKQLAKQSQLWASDESQSYQ